MFNCYDSVRINCPYFNNDVNGKIGKIVYDARHHECHRTTQYDKPARAKCLIECRVVAAISWNRRYNRENTYAEQIRNQCKNVHLCSSFRTKPLDDNVHRQEWQPAQ